MQKIYLDELARLNAYARRAGHTWRPRLNLSLRRGRLARPVPRESPGVARCRCVRIGPGAPAGAGVDKTPASAGHLLDSPGQLAAKGPDDEVTYPADHKQEAEGIPDEPGTQIMTPPMRITRPLSSSRVGTSPSANRSLVSASTPAPTRRTTNGPSASTKIKSTNAHRNPICSATRTKAAISAATMSTALTKNTPQGNPSPASAGSAPLPTPRADQEGI